MTNRAAGEIYRTTSILSQVFGETVSNAFGLVFYQKSDGKLYRAQANAQATVSGKLFICLDAATVENKTGNVLAQGIVEKTGWSWTVGGLVYVSPTTAGGLTQTVPGGSNKIRPVGYAVAANQIDFRPMWGTGATYSVDITGISGDATGNVLVSGPTGWGGYSAATNHPILPVLPNRVLMTQDTTGNQLEIHQVWIPFFKTAGFTDPSLNNILCGGFWVDKYQACQPAATSNSRGGLEPNNPGAGVGAACKPHVVPWTDIDWNHAKIAIENRGGAANKATGTCTTIAGDYPKSEFLVSNIAHLVGRHIEIVQNGVTYYCRIIQTGKNDEAKYVRIYPDLPADISGNETYAIIGHHMVTPYEWFSMAAWATTFRYQHGLGYPKGNNDWGKDIGDTRVVEAEGLSDPVRYGYNNHAKSRCLTGSGPLSWSLNGRADGVWDLNGNVWEWTFQQVTTDGSSMKISPGFPGENTVVTPPGTSGQRITAMYSASAPTPDGLSLNPDISLPTGQSSGGAPEFDYDGYWFNLATNTYAARRGGSWGGGLYGGVWAVDLYSVPTRAYYNVGFRGAF